MNKAILIGRLTADPELRQTPQGTAVTRFTVAVDRRFRRDSGQQQADFITCVAWRQQAEFICRYFNKGKLIGIEGSIQTSSWEKDGQRHYSTEVLVDNVEFVGSKSESGSGSNGAYQSNFGGHNAPQQQNQAPQQPEKDLGFVDLSFPDDAGSEDDLPF